MDGQGENNASCNSTYTAQWKEWIQLFASFWQLWVIVFPGRSIFRPVGAILLRFCNNFEVLLFHQKCTGAKNFHWCTAGAPLVWWNCPIPNPTHASLSLINLYSYAQCPGFFLEAEWLVPKGSLPSFASLIVVCAHPRQSPSLEEITETWNCQCLCISNEWAV